MENEFVTQIKHELAEYGKSLGEVGQLRLIGIVSRVLGLFLLIFTLLLCALAVFAFIAVALINVLSLYMPVWGAALIVGSIYILLIIIAIVCRKPLFIHPFIKALTKQIRSEEELALKTLEAEHKAELSRVRIQGHVEDATREITFYASLLARVWEAIKRFFRKSFLILAVAVGLCACGGKAPQIIPTSYNTLTISKSDISVPLKFSATLKGTADVTITPQISGQLMEVCITEGQQVKKGQVLFRIDSRDARLELESAEANLLAAQAQESSAKLEFESNTNLFNKGIVSKYVLDNAENQYKQAKASVAQYRATANRARVNLSYCTITAPVDGVIGSIPVFAGDQVSPSTYLTMVSGNAKMYAEFSVSESVLEERVNGDADGTLENFPDVTFLFKSGTEYGQKGRITSITGTVDRTTGALTCKATFPNPNGVLYSGIQGTVVIPFDVKDVIVVPQNAIVRLQNKSLAYKVGADSCAYSAIVETVGIGSDRDLVVTKGLEEGDVIVTEGANNLVEGQRVLFPSVKED